MKVLSIRGALRNAAAVLWWTDPGARVHAGALALAIVLSSATTSAQTTLAALPAPPGVHARFQAVLFASPTGSGSACTEQLPGPLESARDKVRTLNAAMSADIVVYLRGGTYELAHPFELGPLDSGTGGHEVIYRAYRTERPVFSGGRRITGFTPVAGTSAWRAGVATDVITRQMYVNGVRAVRATSNAGIPGNAARTATGYTTNDTSMQSWTNASDVELVYTGGGGTPGAPWTESRCGVASITGSATSTTITMRQPGFHNGITKGPGPQDIRMPTSIENAYALIDQPGEWYLDRAAHVLYYIPRDGEDLATADVVVPLLETLVQGLGTPAAPVHDVRFSGITFAYATWLRPSGNDGFIEIQANVTLVGNGSETTPANVFLHGARNVTFERNTFAHLGAMGLAFDGGSQRNTIRGNVFADVSASALRIGDVYAPNAAPADQERGNQVLDNFVHDCCVEFHGGVGIQVGYTAETNIAHNEIVNMPYSGISVGWGWGALSYAERNTIVHNRVQSVMQLLSDGGSIYTLSPQPGSFDTGNYLLDSMVNGIYHDEGSAYFTDYGNVVQGVRGYWLQMWTSSIHDNDVEYNWTDTTSILDNSTNCVVANNVFVPSGNWPATARTIVAGAGIEPDEWNATGLMRNVALRKPASASSVFLPIYQPSLANDGSINLNDGSDGGWSPTGADSNPWWQVDLERAQRIAAVELVTRQNCCDSPGTRSNFEIRGSNDPTFATYAVLAQQGPVPLPFKATFHAAVTDTGAYRYVRATRSGYFFVAELRVLAAPEVDVAIRQPASASSIWDTIHPASLANDDSLNVNDGTDGGWSPAASDSNPSWQVDLGSEHRITRVELVTRQNCCDNSETRRNFEVRASNDPTFATYAVLGAQGSTALPFRATWSATVGDTHAYRYVRATKSGYFFIAELRVFGWSTDAALNRPATTSSIYSALQRASLACDGSINLNDGSGGGWSPTASDPSPWWQVDLGRPRRIRSLDLVTRQNCCDNPETRRNFEVRASNDPSFGTYVVLGSQGSTPLPFQATWHAEVSDPRTYRYVRATKNGYFFIAELRVNESAH